MPTLHAHPSPAAPASRTATVDEELNDAALPLVRQPLEHATTVSPSRKTEVDRPPGRPIDEPIDAPLALTQEPPEYRANMKSDHTRRVKEAGRQARRARRKGHQHAVELPSHLLHLTQVEGGPPRVLGKQREL